MRTPFKSLLAALAATYIVGCGSGDDEGNNPPVNNAPPAGNQAIKCESPTALPPGQRGTVSAQEAASRARPSLAQTLRFTIRAAAQDPNNNNNNALRYEFRATDGRISNVNEQAGTATWTPPRGPGLHFVYVLVKNNRGGYVQRRVAISTEPEFGGEPLPPVTPRAFAPPPSPEPNCFPFRSYARTSDLYGANNGVGGDSIHLPDVEYVAREAQPVDPLNPAPEKVVAVSDLRGSFVIDRVPPGDIERPDVGNTIINAQISGNRHPAGTTERAAVGVNVDPVRGESNNDVFGQPLGFAQPIRGRILLGDNGKRPGGNIQACGFVSEFFQKEVTATVDLLDQSNNVLATRRANYQGHFAFPAVSSAQAIRIRCEQIEQRITLANLNPETPIVLPNSRAPLFNGSDITAESNSNLAPLVVPLEPFSTGSSDTIPDEQFFLDYKGIDTALGACMYYRAIGAVRECGPNGELVDPITFADWQAAVGIDATPGAGFARNNAVQIRAKFINGVDLNLSRDHVVTQMLDAAGRPIPGEGSGVVCNYLGAGGGLTELKGSILKDGNFSEVVNGVTIRAQDQVNTAVANMAAQKNLVACVAMDHRSYGPNVNGGKPFTTFLIFNAAGELLPRINLDGRTEKFVPGTCVICHGGDKYAGKFPEDGTGFPDIGTHMLPFIVPNFNFADNTVANGTLTRAAQETNLANMNRFIRDHTGATQAAKEAIDGWYARNRNVYDEDFTPQSWTRTLTGTALGANSIDRQWYQQVYKHECMGCHINGPERLNFDRRENIIRLNAAGNEEINAAIDVTSCGDVDIRSSSFIRNLAMPNALRTFDLYWGSDDPALQALIDARKRAGVKGVDNKPRLMAQFVAQYSQLVNQCRLSTTPLR